MPPHQFTVRITVSDDGNFKYSHSHLRVTRGDQVRWEITRGNIFVVRFPKKTPFTQVEFRGIDYHPTVTDFAEVRADAPPGIYRYTVAVAVENKIFIDASPEILVEF
jgi:hypothetical protein